MTEVKYTDRDVRENPDLREKAYCYAFYYEGDFEFMVAAKELAKISEELPVAVTRGVLNCMRADPRVAATLPAPQPQVQNARIIPGTVREMGPRHQRPVIRHSYDLPVRWRGIYLYSSHKTAQVFHMLNTERSRIHYYPAVYEFRMDLYGNCNKRQPDRLAVVTNAQPTTLRPCKVCFAAYLPTLATLTMTAGDMLTLAPGAITYSMEA
jgi:hypothetical protein